MLSAMLYILFLLSISLSKWFTALSPVLELGPTVIIDNAHTSYCSKYFNTLTQANSNSDNQHLAFARPCSIFIH